MLAGMMFLTPDYLTGLPFLVLNKLAVLLIFFSFPTYFITFASYTLAVNGPWAVQITLQIFVDLQSLSNLKLFFLTN